MSNMNSLLAELAWRGLLYQHTEPLDAALSAGVVTGSVAQILNETHVNVTTIGPVYRLGVRFSALPPAQQVLDGALTVLALLLVLSVAGYLIDRTAARHERDHEDR